MKFLLDTCTFLWLSDRTELLSPAAIESCQNPEHELWVHAISAWEIQLKHSLGKLALRMKPQEFFATSTERHGITCAQLEIETIWFLEKLPPVHRDPFDRILIAHALRHGMTLVTPDPNVAKYPVPVVW